MKKLGSYIPCSTIAVLKIFLRQKSIFVLEILINMPNSFLYDLGKVTILCILIFIFVK